MTEIVGSIITDCLDPNTRTWQQLAFASIFGVKPAFLGVSESTPEQTALAAGFNLVDQLGVLEEFSTDETALTIGSSGYTDKHFVELVVGRASAAEKYKLSIGSPILSNAV